MVAVIPAASTTPSGTSSIWTRTGMRAPGAPGEDRVDVGKPLPVGLRVRNIDAAGNAVDVTADNLAIAHQLDLGRVADADRFEIRFLEIAVDPERVGIDERDDVRPNIGVVAELRQW